MKKYVALARVSSREQEREGFSLDVQEKALKRYAAKNSGEIVKPFRIAETASKKEERGTFKEMVTYVRKHAKQIDGLLFYKVDRAARNLKDYLLLEELESEHGIQFISVSQPMENNPSGRLMRRTLATMAAFFAEQHSLDVREGIAARVDSGLPPSRASFGYKNVRVEGRSIVVVDKINAQKVKRIFELFAYFLVPIQKLGDRLAEEGITYCDSKARFSERTLYKILGDRMYIGEIKHQGEWKPGSHERLIDDPTWNRVRVLFGDKVYRSHDMVYAGELIVCGHCGHPITGEVKEKPTKAGKKEYRYYRCCDYHKGDHPRIRLTEAELDEQVLALLDQADAKATGLNGWLAKVVQARTKDSREATGLRQEELRRQLTLIGKRRDAALNMRLDGKMKEAEFDRKQQEYDEDETRLRVLLEECTVKKSENRQVSEEATRIFAALRSLWPTASPLVKRRILEIVFQKFTLQGKTLVVRKRTPIELFLAG